MCPVLDGKDSNGGGLPAERSDPANRAGVLKRRHQPERLLREDEIGQLALGHRPWQDAEKAGVPSGVTPAILYAGATSAGGERCGAMSARRG